MGYIRTWHNIQPGDFGWDAGSGFAAKLVRHFSPSPYAHCWVYHKKYDDNLWETIEAYPGGVRRRYRGNNKVDKVMRIWRNKEEQRKILDQSALFENAKYSYGEIWRIIQYRFNKKRELYLAIAAILLLFQQLYIGATLLGIWLIMQIPWWTTKRDNNKTICSGHVAESALVAREDITLTYPPSQIWPGMLEYDLNNVIWNDRQEKEKNG